MPNIIDTKAAITLVPLVTFIQGANTWRYARWPEDIVVGADTFTAAPTMDIDLGELQPTAAPDGEEVKVVLPALAPFADLDLIPAARVNVRVEEVEATDPTSRRTLFFGPLARVERNHQGRAGIYQLVVVGLKALLQCTLGMQCNSTCNWLFGDVNCGINRESFKVTGVLTQTGPYKVTVTGLTPSPAAKWRRGHVRKDNLWIPIRGITGSELLLDFAPPAAWAGQTVDVLPGCDKTVETCRDVWANEIRHGALGRGMPDRNPQIESAQ